jgi:hypothetical protein
MWECSDLLGPFRVGGEQFVTLILSLRDERAARARHLGVEGSATPALPNKELQSCDVR